MGKPTGFLEYERQTCQSADAPKSQNQTILMNSGLRSDERKTDHTGSHDVWHVEFRSASQDMMLNGMASGCPLHNLVPETE